MTIQSLTVHGGGTALFQTCTTLATPPGVVSMGLLPAIGPCQVLPKASATGGLVAPLALLHLRLSHHHLDARVQVSLPLKDRAVQQTKKRFGLREVNSFRHLPTHLRKSSEARGAEVIWGHLEILLSKKVIGGVPLVGLVLPATLLVCTTIWLYSLSGN